MPTTKQPVKPLKPVITPDDIDIEIYYETKRHYDVLINDMNIPENEIVIEAG